MSFTCEEIWPHLPQMKNRAASVHLSAFPTAIDVLGTNVCEFDESQQRDWTKLRTVRDHVLKALEDAREKKQIGGGLEAKIEVSASEPLYGLLKATQDQLRYLFIVSAVALKPWVDTNGTAGGIIVNVYPADGAKCDRCWNYSTHVGEDKTYPTVCERCSVVLKELEGNG
jgi:isoleucyl-tRNA synthetase